MKIHLLSSEVIDQIAAGEVLERPANLVKELVENSLDAKSSEIEVHVSHGGRSIKIVDNGSGIESDDLALALERHATSKILKSSDLWQLHSFGFRGEALASIAAVSSLKLVSRNQNCKEAYGITSHFGDKSEVFPTGGELGTTIEITELFANVPARLKFLKSDSAEISQIKKTLKALALANLNVTFHVYIEGELFAHWPAKQDWKERVEYVLNKKQLLSSIGTSAGLKINCFFSQPNEVEKTSQQIWLFVNKRWVQDRSLQSAILEAYRNLLMHGEYPVATIFLESAPDLVDVNVHPTKSQVKFSDPKSVFRLVHYSIRNELEKARWLNQVVLGSTESSDAVAPPTDAVSSYSSPSVQIALDEKSSNPAFSVTQFQQKTRLFSPVSSTEAPIEVFSQNSVQASLNVEPKWSGLQVLGQANLTYIVTQNSRGILFIDQHAAHERINFEKLLKSWKEGKTLETQNYLIPLSLTMEPSEIDALLIVKERLTQLGLEIEQGGPDTLFVLASPTLLKEEAIVKSLHKLSYDLLEYGESYVFEKQITDIFATMACHSSVRAGQALSLDEMRALLVQMDEFTLSSFCPHGRPVFVEYSFRDLDSDFGRIV